jgi:octaprenyl-diphosphate synthase
MAIGHVRQVVTADEIFDLVREDLLGVEIAIGIESSASVTAPISKYLERNGEKRLRAGLLLLCARFAGGGGSRMAIELGAVVEMLHAATRVHDDMVDGRLSDEGQCANRACVLAGDWLYIRAFRVAQQERVLDVVLGAAQAMVAAELMQLERIGRIAVTESDCLELADRKTACLFSACGKLGAVAAGVDARVAERVGEFAWNLGMALQLSDDVLGFESNGLQDGKVTLPLVYALEEASSSERELVVGVLRDRGYDAGPLANVLALVERKGGVGRCRERAREFRDRAHRILAEFPDSLCVRALFMLTELVTERDGVRARVGAAE